jgi:periplasmic protein TonB
MSPLRVPFSVVAGASFSVAFFFGLWQMVSVPFDIAPPAEARRIEFTRQIVAEPPVELTTPRPEILAPPVVPIPPRIGPGTADAAALRVQPAVAAVARPPRVGLPMGVDRDAAPLVRVDPEYPPRELARGTEGRVLVRFTVTAAGTVRDASVVSSEPRGVFDKAALDAIARWRYNPRVEGGTAVERVGLQAVIRFEVEN